MNINELDTPAVIVDLDVMERNLTRMAAYCRQFGLALRPHTKSHKIPELARRQIESGSTGITVAKVGEAEVMVDAEINDILIAYPIVSAPKAHRLAKLAERTHIKVSLDSEEAAQIISKAAWERGVKVTVLVEIDVGLHRCGVPEESAALILAKKILELPGLEFGGCMFYPGHIFGNPTDQRAALESLNSRLDHLREMFRVAGIPIPTISGGSTPTAYNSHCVHGLTEIRPGMYIFNDRNMLGIGVATLQDCALSVIVSVVSTAVPGRAIVDGGSKTFSSDRYLAGDGRGYGLIRLDPGAVFETMSEEHGHLSIVNSQRHYSIGDHLAIIPNHVCSTVNMHDEVYGVRGEQVESIWRVAGRGKVR